MTVFPRNVKNAMRTIKAYCNSQTDCFNCDMCFLLRNYPPKGWDIEELELETNCQYVDKCTDLVFANLELQKALREKCRLISDNELLKAERTALEHLLDEKVPNWKAELGGKK